jgi:hypothetical protein
MTQAGSLTEMYSQTDAYSVLALTLQPSPAPDPSKGHHWSTVRYRYVLALGILSEGVPGDPRGPPGSGAVLSNLTITSSHLPGIPVGCVSIRKYGNRQLLAIHLHFSYAMMHLVSGAE